MIKNIAAPCCGTYDVLIQGKEEEGKIWYKAMCPYCKLSSKDEFETKQEAIYDYEKMCIESWRRNPNGLLDWMKKKAKDEKEIKRRTRIAEDMMPYVRQR